MTTAVNYRYLRLFLLVAAPLISLIAGGCLFLYATETKTQTAQLESVEAQQAVSLREVWAGEFHATLTDLRLLSASEEVDMYLIRVDTPAQTALLAEFQRFLSVKAEFISICLLDDRLNPLVCAPTASAGGGAGSPIVLPPLAEIFPQADALPERAALAGWYTLQPAVFALLTPHRDTAGRTVGYLCFLLDASPLVTRLETEHGAASGKTLLIASNGEWITSPVAPASETAAPASSWSLAENLPEVWQSITAADSGQFIHTSGLYTFETIHTLISDTISAENQTPALLKIVRRTPSPALAANTRNTAFRYIAWFWIAAAPTLLVAGRIARSLERSRAAEDALSQEISAHKELAGALQERENWLRSVLEYASVAIVITDRHGRIRLVNQKIEEMFGYPRQELIDQPIEALLPRRYRDRHANLREQYIGNPRPRMMGNGLMLFARHQDGREFPVEVGLSTVETQDGLIVMSYLSDITERKNAEDALKLSELKYRHLFENTLVGMYRTRLEDGEILEANSAMRRLFGADETITVRAAELYADPTDRDLLVKLLRSEGSLLNFETRLKRLDGREFWVSLSAKHYPMEGCMEGVLIDISERKRVEQELEKSLSLLQATLESTADAIVAIDRDGGMVNFNRRFFEVWGISEDVLSRQPQDRLSVLAAKTTQPLEFMRIERNIIESGEDKDRFDVIGLKDGRTLEWYSRPQRVGERVVGRVWNFRDITERKRSVEALQKAFDETQLVTARLTTTVAELERRAFEANLMNELGDMLQSCNTPEEAYTVISRYLRQFFPEDSGALGVLKRHHNLVEIVTTWGALDIHEPVFDVNACWALRRGQVHLECLSDGSLLCSHLQRNMLAPAGSAALNYMCVPLLAHSEPLGLLHIQLKESTDCQSGAPTSPADSDGDGGAPSADEHKRQLAISIAERIALSLANLRLRESLHEQAIHDPLTGLFNRRYMNDILEREMRRAARRQTPLSLIMMDVDHFKQFNDRYGHPAGDVLLQEIASFLHRHVRAEDVICRYGGEEFVIILPGATGEDSRRRAEQIWERVRGIEAIYHGQSLGPITLSLGVAVYPDHADKPETLLRVADDMLYRAKTTGRNRVVAASHLSTHSEDTGESV